VAIGVGADHLFVRLAKALGREDLLGDPEFVRNEDRVANRARLQHELERTLATDGVSHWVERIGAAGVPVDTVNDVGGVLEDPQLDRIEGWLDVSVPGRSLRQPALPIRLGGKRLPLRRDPPTLGDTRAR
jgi:formyl-CoA transferase